MVSEELFEKICLKKINTIHRMRKDKRLFIYSAGVGGRIFAKILNAKGINYEGFIDKNANKLQNVDKHKVFDINEISTQGNFIVVALREYDSDAVESIRKKGFSDNDFYVIAAGIGFNKVDILYKGCKIGRYTYGYEGLLEYAPLAESIGRYCSINTSAKIVNNHSLDCVTTHPFLDHPAFLDWEQYLESIKIIEKYGKYQNNSLFENSKIRNNPSVVIGNDVWIGANVVILPGVKIGDGAVLAAGSIITKDVKPYQIVAGNPAKQIRMRFDDDIIKKLLDIKWWEWEHHVIESNIELLFDPKLFVDKYNL